MIGIIGYGFVGKAVANSYDMSDVRINDPAHPNLSVSVSDLIDCEAIYVCVPTPPISITGGCDTTILHEVLYSLNELQYRGMVIIKSTAPPPFFNVAKHLFNLKMAYVPEFLTQANSNNDYLNPHRILVGCESNFDEQVYDILKKSRINFDGNYEFCTMEEASFIKYLCNTQLAMKVIINNEFKALADSMNVDWEQIATLASGDYRLGATHWQVPGPDGLGGYGGACFPKDVDALLCEAKRKNVKMVMLETARQTNKALRK